MRSHVVVADDINNDKNENCAREKNDDPKAMEFS